MFRGPQFLGWSCPIRPFLLLRESHLAALSEKFENPCAGSQGASAVRDRSYEVVHQSKRSSLSAEALSCSTQLSPFSLDCGNQHPREASHQHFTSKAVLSHHFHGPQVSDSAEQASDSWKCTVVENSVQNLRAVNICQNCSTSTTYPRPRRGLCGVSQPSHSFINKSQCSFPLSHLYHRRNFVRPPSLSTHQAWLLSHIHRSPQPCGISSHQTRASHQAAPPDAWRSCLSPENEDRCRQSLGPNFKLYESDKGRKGISQSQGKNQANWASVLVSLCSVEGEPAFLFTLRSSKLKGRHKGDVSFAGGKSDPSDRDVVATALREAKEELGINVTAERVWGILKPLRDMSGMMVAPVLANLGPLEMLTFKPNPGEVEEIFTLSLSHLINPQNRGYTHFRTGNKYGYTTPVFRNAKYRVWGLTAIALDHSLKLIVPP